MPVYGTSIDYNGELKRFWFLLVRLLRSLCYRWLTYRSKKSNVRQWRLYICNGHDVFAVWLPTGYGQAFSYQALPFIMNCKRGLVGSQERSLVLVVSPLIALMVDQVTSLRKGGVNCSASVKSIEST